VKFKQFGSELGEVSLNYSEMGKRRIETLYAGNRPNCLRVYDKTAEQMTQYKKAVRGMAKASPDLRKSIFQIFGAAVESDPRSLFDGVEKRPHPGQAVWLAESGYKPDLARGLVELHGDSDATPAAALPVKIPTFQEWSGLNSSDVLTRVERQCGGQRIPVFFRNERGDVTVATLWSRLQFGYKGQHFDPYESLVFVADSGKGIFSVAPECDPVIPLEIGSGVYATILGLRALIAEQGMQKAGQILESRTPGSRRLIEKYARHLPAEKLGLAPVRFSRDELFQQFRCSIQKQFGCAA
jgi:hypothetical protein